MQKERREVFLNQENKKSCREYRDCICNPLPRSDIMIEINEGEMRNTMDDGLETILRGGQFKRLIEISLAEIREETGLKRVEVEI